MSITGMAVIVSGTSSGERCRATQSAPRNVQFVTKISACQSAERKTSQIVRVSEYGVFIPGGPHDRRCMRLILRLNAAAALAAAYRVARVFL